MRNFLRQISYGKQRSAEEHGFSFALISDHYHPWTNRQGQSPFVWAGIGEIAATTRKLAVGTGVTCPTFRIHPAIIAQAAATATTMMPGRFFLGVGTGCHQIGPNQEAIMDFMPKKFSRRFLERARCKLRNEGTMTGRENELR